MKSQVFSIFDSKTETFGLPGYFHNKGHALRMFETKCNEQGTDLAMYPEDFSFFHVGEFDDSNGLLTPLTPPVNVGLAVEFRRSDK